MSTLIFTRPAPMPEVTPDDRAVFYRDLGIPPSGPHCDRCNRVATDANPIGITRRPSWDPFKNIRQVDKLCRECRESYR